MNYNAQVLQALFFCATYPQLVVMVKGVQQLDDVAVVAFSQDFDLDHVVLQLLFGFGLDLFGRG